jgi:hypothetical protein
VALMHEDLKTGGVLLVQNPAVLKDTSLDGEASELALKVSLQLVCVFD